MASEKYLENAALYYLQRYASSAQRLRRVLMRRVDRSARAHGTDPKEGAAVVEALIRRLEQRKLVDDPTFAASRARALRQRGASQRMIRARLGADGIDPESADAALAGVEESELEAAIIFARRRRLGPFRLGPDRGTRRDQDLASLGRAGFPYEIARKIIDAASPEEVNGIASGA